MATNEHTQALLDELREPTHAGRLDAATAILDFSAALATVRQQAAHGAVIVQRAGIAETEPEISEKLERFRQTFRAMEDRARDVERQADELLAIFAQLDRYAEGLRELAGGRGYTP